MRVGTVGVWGAPGCQGSPGSPRGRDLSEAEEVQVPPFCGGLQTSVGGKHEGAPQARVVLGLWCVGRLSLPQEQFSAR